MTNSQFSEFSEAKSPALEATLNPALKGVTVNAGSGVEGVNFETQVLGLLGRRDKIFKQNVGVYGQSNQQGVFGHSTADSGTGVFGSCAGSGIGVRGNSTVGIAVQGECFDSGIAVEGKSFGKGIAIHGIASSLAGSLAGSFIGNVKVNGNIDCTGDITLINEDCAEDFYIVNSETVEPGTVMVIESNEVLRQSSCAYDKRVAGVISGAGKYKPALILGKKQSSENRMPIALMGKVYCKVDAQYGEIEVGDLLTSSPTAGYAMKASDPRQSFGAVLGKALSPLREGQAMIPILVSLQ